MTEPSHLTLRQRAELLVDVYTSLLSAAEKAGVQPEEWLMKGAANAMEQLRMIAKFELERQPGRAPAPPPAFARRRSS